MVRPKYCSRQEHEGLIKGGWMLTPLEVVKQRSTFISRDLEILRLPENALEGARQSSINCDSSIHSKIGAVVEYRSVSVKSFRCFTRIPVAAEPRLN